MAISEKKLAANRANARRSTGPRTPSGKAAAARNALVHGLSARGALLPGDDSREFQRFGIRVFEELEPAGALQEELAAEIVNLSWKLRRVPGAESILMAQEHAEGRPTPLRVICNMILAKKAWDHSPNSPLWILDRYASRIERARVTALRMLLALQKREPQDGGDANDLEEEKERDVRPGPAGAGIDNAPGQNEPTAGPSQGDAQPVVSTTDTMLDSPPAGDSAAPSEATAAAGNPAPSGTGHGG